MDKNLQHVCIICISCTIPRFPCSPNTVSLSNVMWFRLLLYDFGLSSLTPPSCSPLPQTRSVMGPCGMQFPSSQLQSLLRKGTMWWSQLTCPPRSFFWSGDARGNVLSKYEKSEGEVQRERMAVMFQDHQLS